jgi:hypothetical protein
MRNSKEKKESNEKITEVRDQLKPLFLGFYQSSPSYRAYTQAQKRIKRRTERMNSILTALGELKPRIEELPPRYRIISRASRYLFYVEIFGNFYVNLAILLSVGNEHALHLMPDYEHRFIRHATSLKDIESPTLSLASKLGFLKSCKMPLFKKWIDSTLRNRIAHADFTIDDDGNLSYQDKDGKPKTTDLKWEQSFFNEYLDPISKVFREILTTGAQTSR